MLYKLSVANIKCGGCAHSISSKLTSLDAVTNVEVNHEDGTVAFDAQSDAKVNEVKSILEKMGYPEGDPTMMQTAKSYVSCAIGKVTKNL